MGLDSVERVLLAEPRFGLCLDDAQDALSRIRPIDEFCDLLHARLNPPGAAPGPDWQMSYGIVAELLVAHFQVPPYRITPEARIIADLGLQ